MSRVRYAFAGDRDIAVAVLDFLMAEDEHPEALLVSAPPKATHAEALIELAGLPRDLVARGAEFRTPTWLAQLAELDLDFIIAVHFPYIIPSATLAIPAEGVLNLHPAFLPYNRGWHTPSWAILEDTPIGATLHFMDASVDTGDIVHQRQLEVLEGDTAHTLYGRVKRLELAVFREAWPSLRERSYRRTPQPAAGTSHRRSDLLRDQVRRIELDERVQARELIRRLRALTTSDPAEAAFYEVDGRRYRLQVVLEPDNPLP